MLRQVFLRTSAAAMVGPVTKIGEKHHGELFRKNDTISLRFVIPFFIFIFCLLPIALSQDKPWYLIETGSVPKDSGFKMQEWFIWCGSAIEVDGTYHLFASRWPKSTGFPEGYMTHSEIVRATADNPLGPYTFQEVVLGKRDPKYWDAIMTHNPSIYKTGDTYVLYYNARGNAPYRQIGYATTRRITGPWTRNDQPIDFGRDANNPAAFFEPDGSVKLMWRDRTLGIYIATAPSYKGPYTIVNNNVWPYCKLEDFYLFKLDGKYHMICEDNVGAISGHSRWGVHLTSDDGIHDWHPTEPVVFYNHAITWPDGTGIHCQRRERPQLLIDETGNITHLFTSVLFQGETWNQPVPISLIKKSKTPPYRNITTDSDTGN